MTDTPSTPATKATEPLRCAWWLGWAVPVSWFENLARELYPQDEHVFFEPSPVSLERWSASDPFDVTIGYSLGALLLLREPAMVRRSREVTLLAPIFALPTEAGLGGRVASTQIKFLRRWLRRDPAAAVKDFYARAGLSIELGATLPASVEDLVWGLEQLETVAVAARLPSGWTAWVGETDPLVDSGFLRQLVPGIEVVPRAGHAPRPLLAAWKDAQNVTGGRR